MGFHISDYKKQFSGDIFFYGNASQGFYEILVWLQNSCPKEEPNVVLPVFIPAKLYRIVLGAGYKPKFYDVSLSCQMDVEEVKSLVDEQTQAVFYIHYFGIPANLKELKSYTDANEIFLIEDCAHTLNSEWQGKELGSTGDCAIFSTRKMLQLPSGGFMVFNNKQTDFRPGYSKRVRSIYTACKMFQMRAKKAYYYLTRGQDPLKLARIPEQGYIKIQEKQIITSQNDSWLNTIYIHSVDLDEVVNRRRINYEYLLNGVKDSPYLKPIVACDGESGMIIRTKSGYRLQEGITPYSFPVLVPSGMRSILLKTLREKGIGCSAGWPESPFGKKGFRQAEELSERLLEFPIHQGINRHQLDRIIGCIDALHETSLIELNKKASIKTKAS